MMLSETVFPKMIAVNPTLKITTVIKIFTQCLWWMWRLAKTVITHGSEGTSWLLIIHCRRLCSALHYTCATSLQSKGLRNWDLQIEFQMCLPCIYIAQLLLIDFPVLFFNVNMCSKGPFKYLGLGTFYSLMNAAIFAFDSAILRK